MNNLSNKCKFFLHISLVILVFIISVDGGRTHNQNRGRNVTHYPQKKFSNGNNHSISKPNQNRGHTVTHQPHSHLSHSQDQHKISNQNKKLNTAHHSQNKISNGNNHSTSKPNQNKGHNVTRYSNSNRNDHHEIPNRNRVHNITQQPHRNFSHSQNQHKISNGNQGRNTTNYSQNKFSNRNNHSISNPNQNKGYNVTRHPNSNHNDHHEIPNRNTVHNITQQPHKNFSHPQNRQKQTNQYQGRNSTHVSKNKLLNGNNHSISYPHRNREHNITHNPHSNSSNWNNHPKTLNQNKTHSTTHFPRNNSANWTDHPKLYPDRIRDHNITHRPSNNFPIGWNVDTNTPPSNKLPIGWNADTNTTSNNKIPFGWNADTNTTPSNKLPIGWNADTNTPPSNKLPIGWNDNSNTHTSTNSPIGWDVNINIHSNNNLPMKPVNPDVHLEDKSNHHAVLYPSNDDSTVNVHSHYDKQPDKKKPHNRLRPHYHNKDRNPHQEYSPFSNKTLLYKPNSAIKGKLIIEDDLPIPRTICGKTLCSYVLNYPTTEIEDAVGRANEVLQALILNAYPINQDSSQIINAKYDSSSLTYSTVSNDQLEYESGLCKKYTNEISPLEGFNSEDGMTYHIVNVPSFAQTVISIECDSSNGLTCGQTIGATLLENRACQQLYREEKLVVLPVGKRYYKNDDFHIRTINVPTDCNCIVSRQGQ